MSAHNFATKKDLRLEMRIKNNVLYEAIHFAFPSISAFCRKHKKKLGGNAQGQIGSLINFKIHPRKAKLMGDAGSYVTDEYRSICLKLSVLLKTSAEELFPDYLYEQLVGQETKKVIEVSSFTALPFSERKNIQFLEGPPQPDYLERDELKKCFREALNTLPPKYRMVIELRYGLCEDGREHTFEEIGQIIKLSGGRIQQIERRAIRLLQKPYWSRKLTGFLY